jgi:hypothetical protein
MAKIVKHPSTQKGLVRWPFDASSDAAHIGTAARQDSIRPKMIF